ncbi:DUF4236 domain-containing protein [Bradyrhizobium arachidis]|uniref:DUF4236 domain-containing protein n=1 Tax=Bradyrhizobium arachidis TaxID=858423 RepID=UPI0021624043|nr:DUF4236 domain-containing protein [Bradyrhizobium arachidis]UVO34505.1 DUF4236 domain-containing protein [Bradyrhizobium arachidis]
MGFRFRQSFKIIPGIRLNLSGSGASVSFGPRGAHFTIGPHGTRTTVGLPGTGVSWTAYQAYSPGRRSSAPDRALANASDTGANEVADQDRSATVIGGAPIEQLVTSSTIDIADALNASRSSWQLYKTFIAALVALFVGGALVIVSSAPRVSPGAAFIVVAGAVIILGAITVRGLQSNTILLEYDLSGEAAERFEALGRAFGALTACSRIWRIPLERQEADWKRNAGVSKTVERKQVSPRRGNPSLVKCNVEFLQLPLGNETLYFTPDAILVIAGTKVAAFRYKDVEIVSRPTRFVEDGTAPNDTQVVAETWRFVNRNGGPDRRFNNNRKLPTCLYGEIDFKSAGGLNERMHCSRVEAAESFVSAMSSMRSADWSGPPPNDNSHVAPVAFGNLQDRGSKAVDVGAVYAQETEVARALAENHGKLWEFLLVQELLSARLPSIKTECANLSNIVTRKLYAGREFVDWVHECGDLSSAIKSMEASVKDLMRALGEPGTSGNAIEILNAVDSLFSSCRRFLEFESSVRAAEVPSAFSISRTPFLDLRLAWFNRSTISMRNGLKKQKP